MLNETQNQIRLRHAKEALAACREAEDIARKALAAAVERTKRAKEQHEALFMEEERQECERRRNSYHHCTK